MEILIIIFGFIAGVAGGMGMGGGTLLVPLLFIFGYTAAYGSVGKSAEFSAYVCCCAFYTLQE